MIFNTAWFVLFFPAFIAILWLIPGRMARLYFLLAASSVFHFHFAGPAGVAPIVVMAAAVYFIAIRIEEATPEMRRPWLWIGLGIPIAGLTWYKYRVFLSDGFFNGSPMPLAISFFTFEFVQYLTEIYKGGKALRRPAQFALFCIYFPSIVSGPIKRYSDFCPQIEHGLAHPSKGKGLEGLAQLILGFFKKMVIADNVNVILGLMQSRTSWHPWHVVGLIVLLSIRILFDFSGYSDIAIGLSKIIGLDLPANFNFPYLASNIQDFWRRWHMSLSSWIRDYIYIPLGGSRQGMARKSLNSLIAMALCGLWHGAAWNFLAWGVYHGMGMAVHGAYRKQWPEIGIHSRSYLVFARVLTLSFIGYGWLLFFYPLNKVLFYSRCLFGFSS